MTHLPFFYYPTTWLCVDDDSLLTASISNALGKLNCIKSFHSSLECLKFFEHYQSFFKDQSFLHTNTRDEKYGTLEFSSVDFNVTDLAKLANMPDKQNEITAMVIDYRMPEMNGFSLAKELHNFSFQKLLLTGEADHHDTIDGFNSNLINGYIEKGDSNLFDKLSTHLNKLTYQFFQAISLPLLTHLESDTKMASSDPCFIDFFEKFRQENNIKEYYLIDKLGSYLCIDSKGKRSCLVVQTEKSLEEWLSLYQDEPESITSKLKTIKTREKIPFFGIGVESWKILPQEWSHYYYNPILLEGRERYYLAKIDIKY